MNIIDIIIKKKNCCELSEKEIDYVVQNYVNGTIYDYQMSAFLMAVTLNNLTDDELFFLTKSMINSGNIIDLSVIKGICVDKHSTGGVGDKTTIALLPLLATLGFKVAKMSGRGLGHTGGTIDKLESINGYNVDLTEEELIKQVNDIGISVISQTNEVAIADKKIYALRDVTGLAESIPLIAASIMSKKIASNADIIVIDVKVGNGALMKDLSSATELSNRMIQIGKRFNKKVICILTNMNEPLGYAIGNGLEVLECIDFLNGNGPSDLKKIIYEITKLFLNEIGKSDEESLKLIEEKIDSKEALKKFNEWISYQGGNINDISISNNVISIKSIKDGVITNIDAYRLGNIAKKLGAGRYSKGDIIDYSVGIVLNKKVGDMVLFNEELVKVYVGDKSIDVKEIVECFEINDSMPKSNDLIIDIIK